MRRCLPVVPGVHACLRGGRAQCGPDGRAESEPALDVVELSLAAAGERMAAGTLTARALTQAYLDRIAIVDDGGPQLNAVIEINPSALKDADALDAERKAGKVRGPLHGIPVLLKDNIDVAGMVNSAGSLALADAQAAAGRVHRHAAARSGRGDPREDEPQRVGQLPLDAVVVWLELTRGPDQEPLRARSQPLWIERRHRLGDRGEPGGGRYRHRDRRQHHLSGGGQRARRHSSPPSGSSAAAASFRFRSRRTPPDRWAAPSPTSRR